MSKANPSWKQILSRSITSPRELAGLLGTEEDGVQAVIERYPMRINPYYGSLIKDRGDPIYLQCVPDIQEIADQRGYEDPLNEEGLSPVRGLTHRYPDRVLFLVSSRCAVYCRFCNRKRKVGSSSMVRKEAIREGISYIRDHKEIRDVLLSGGDPLLLEDGEIFELLQEIRAISHVEIIRIGTRVPCTLPQRVTARLVAGLKRFHPLYIHTHFNHPFEITPEATLACKRLGDAGLPLGCHTVLLKGVNDDPEVMKELMRRLLTIRVRPYYLFQPDLARGTAHFWTPLSRGLKILSALQGHTSGLCVPHFAVDLPGGGGKVPMIPEYILGQEGDALRIRNYKGEEFLYPLFASGSIPN
jgi:lysine 2,3-aminomutase